MKILSDLLSRYAHIQTPHATVKKVFIQKVEECIDIQLTPEQVVVKGTTVWLQAPSVIKSAVRMHQQDILNSVSEELGNKQLLNAIQ